MSSTNGSIIGQYYRTTPNSSPMLRIFRITGTSERGLFASTIAKKENGLWEKVSSPQSYEAFVPNVTFCKLHQKKLPQSGTGCNFWIERNSSLFNQVSKFL